MSAPVYRIVVETRRPTKVHGVLELLATRTFGPYGSLGAAREALRLKRTSISATHGYIGAGHVEQSPTDWSPTAT